MTRTLRLAAPGCQSACRGRGPGLASVAVRVPAKSSARTALLVGIGSAVASFAVLISCGPRIAYPSSGAGGRAQVEAAAAPDAGRVAGVARAAAERAAAPALHYAHVASMPLPPSPSMALDVALDAEGRMWLADARGRALVEVLAPAGPDLESPVRRLPTDGVPVAIAPLLDGTDRMYVLLWDDLGARLETWSASGARLGVAGVPDRRFGPDDDRMVLDVAVDPDSGLPVVLNHAVVHRPRGTPESLTFDGGTPHGRATQQMRIAALPGGVTAIVLGVDGSLSLARGGTEVSRVRFGALRPLDVAANPDGSASVLLDDGGRPAIATVDATGAIVGPPEPLAFADGDPDGVATFASTPFRYSLAVAPGGDQVALTVGARRIVALRADRPSLVAVPWSYGSRVPANWDLASLRWSDNPVTRAVDLSLAVADDGELTLLDAADARVLEFSVAPAAGAGGAAPIAVTGQRLLVEDARDFALEGDRLWISTETGRIRTAREADAAGVLRYDVGAGLAGADFDCACPLGGRLALVLETAGAPGAPGAPAVPTGAAVWTTLPAERTLAAYDGAGARLRSISPPEAFGLWPSDIAAAPDGRILAGDLVTGGVTVWSGGDAPDVEWLAGVLGGVRRLAAARLDDGSEVAVAALADGALELHAIDDGLLLARWLPKNSPETSAAAISPADVAVLADGRVLAVDGRGRALHVYAPAETPPETPSAPEPTPAPSPEPWACSISGRHSVAPARIALGETASVQLTLDAECPPRLRLVGADIVLALDRSSSVRGDVLRAAQAAARSFVELLDVRFHRVGLVSFASEVSLDAPLDDDLAPVMRAIDALKAEGETDISGALEVSAAHLRDARRSDVLPVIVLLTDGRDTVGTDSPVGAAARIQAEGIQIYAIGLGDAVDESVLRLVASGPDRYFRAPTPAELFPIYKQILRLVVSTGVVAEVVVEDDLPADIGYVSRSALPPAVEGSDRLTWGRPILPAGGMTMTFEIRPTRLGRMPVSRRAEARFIGDDGIERLLAYPIPEIEVFAPTATPVVPTATPVPSRAWLPIALGQHCLPDAVRADAVLLIDTSSSMEGAPLEAARRAAREFVGLLDLGRDRAAVVAFDGEVERLTGLTDDLASLNAGLDALTVGSGTRIDLALTAALEELSSAEPAPGTRHGVAVLLSDGGQTGAREPAIAAADELRRAGFGVFVVGFGDGADLVLLEAVADPGALFHAPTAAELATMYRRVATAVRCR